MSYFDDASLVMIPSGYKTSKVYSVKPLDGTGDLTFTRTGDTASRVAPNGLIERVRTNLITYSEDWSNAAWTKTNATVTANATTNPINGATTADAIFETSATGQHNFFNAYTTTSGAEVTISFYAKANGRTKLRMNNGSSAITAAFDLTAVTASMLTGSGTPTITSVGSGWFRCSLRYTATSTEYVAMNFRDDLDQDSYAGDITKGMYFFGAQAETGVLTDYIATTSAAVSVGPVANVPRLDYLGSSCPRLLLEPQRTNIAQYSESFDNAFWNKSGNIAVTANAAVSPDGYTNADLIYGASSGTISSLQRSIGAAGVNTYTNSIFVKYSGKQWFYIFEFSGNSGGNFFDIQNGVLGTQNFGSGGFITPYGNGWYKVGFTQSLTSGNVWAIYGISNADNVYTNTASGFDGAYVWGAQLEIGAYATSYIPTLGASVTRGADFTNKASIGSLLPSQTGTLYVEFDWQKTPVDVQVMSIHNNSTGLAWIAKQSDTAIQGTYFASGYIGTINGTISASSGVVKVAYAWTNESQALYVNGVQIGTASATISDSNDLNILEFNGFWGITKGGTSIAQSLIFNSRLSNSDLAALTA